jgi:hypothetical protein
MPVIILLLGAATFSHLIGKIHVSWRAEVIAGDELRGQGPQPLVRNCAPRSPGQQERMQPDSPVRRRDPLGAPLTPGRDDAVDRSRIEGRTVAEDHDGRLHIVP